MHIQTQVFKLKKAPEKKNGAFILKTTVTDSNIGKLLNSYI